MARTFADLPDVARFVDTIRDLAKSSVAEARELFVPGAPIFVSRAPGRLDVMGGIAAYSGSLVLELPVAEATLAAVQPVPERVLRIVSLRPDGSASAFELPLSAFMTASGDPVSYEAPRLVFSSRPGGEWAAYAAGVFLVLMREKGARFSTGARSLLSSQVPEGKGVSSSAAIEVATMQAVAAAFGIELHGPELGALCQTVENRVVGAPCGIMDQMTSALGEQDQFLALLCQPAVVERTVPIPEDVAFWGIDSGVRHSVSGADYGSVRVGAFIGYRVLADLAGLEVTPGATPGTVAVRDPRWNGYLANVCPSEWEQSFAAQVPEHLTGAEFIERYAGTTDPITRVDPARTYAVRVPTAHPIYENFRVRAFAELMSAPQGERRQQVLGELMFQSHASYSACGLGSAATDRLVELVRQVGPDGGLYGAKITGGGSGGTVAVLSRRDAGQAVREVAARFEQETGYHPYVFRGSSPGACAFGTLRLDSIDGTGRNEVGQEK